MILLADGGSTKVEWVLKDDNENIVIRYKSIGLNPSLLSDSEIAEYIANVVKEQPLLLTANHVEYYGAGCTPIGSARLRSVMENVFKDAATIDVGSDIIGAAKALFGEEEGIACILGTGACSCHWGMKDDGKMGILHQTPSLGYVLGDEGSGAVLGRMFINALYKGRLPETLRHEFEKEYDIDMFGVIDKVYRQPQPNRWLASISTFINKHIEIKEVEELVEDNLKSFFIRNILPYNRVDLKVSFVGSIAYYYEKQLRSEAAKLNITIGTILKSPL